MVVFQSTLSGLFFSLTVIASAFMLAQVAKSKFVIRFLCDQSTDRITCALQCNKTFFHFLSPRVDMMLKDSIINEQIFESN